MCFLSTVEEMQGAVLKMNKDENGLLMRHRVKSPVIVKHKAAVPAWHNFVYVYGNLWDVGEVISDVLWQLFI